MSALHSVLRDRLRHAEAAVEAANRAYALAAEEAAEAGIVVAQSPTPTHDQIAAASAEALRDVAYVCGRVWEAWQVGTMSEDDFAPAWEDDELTGSIADAVLTLLQKGADR